MKFLKYLLFTVIGIVALALIAALFVSKEFVSESEIIIDKPQKQVFDYIGYVKNQDNFGVWQLTDPDAKMTEEGTDGTVGFKYSWEGEKVGKGSQTITAITPNEKLETELDFGFGTPSQSYMIAEKINENQTKVKWGISGTTPYPWNLMSLFYDLGNDFEEGLKNLKEILEAQETVVDEKATLRNEYQETLNKLQESISGLSKEQMHFKSSPESWSISQCLEHIIITEKMIFAMIQENMKQPVNPEDRDKIQFSDEEIIPMAADRTEKFKAPEILIADGKYDDPKSALGALEEQRKEVHAFINDVEMEDLRNRINASPSGFADTYQSLLFIAGHTTRHTLQIEEIKANADFPK